MIPHSLTVHMQVFQNDIHFTLMYMEDHSLPVPPIKDLINKDGDPTTPFKLATSMKYLISHLRVLFSHVLYEELL